MKFKVILSQDVQADVEKLKKSGDKKSLKKLYTLLEELVEHPKTATGKPELLKHYAEPTWSRRISGEHRLVYEIRDKVITVLVLSAYGHYGNK